jgi:hypothetical protein
MHASRENAGLFCAAMAKRLIRFSKPSGNGGKVDSTRNERSHGPAAVACGCGVRRALAVCAGLARGSSPTRATAEGRPWTPAGAPGKAPADEEGSSSKKAASAATAKGAAPGGKDCRAWSQLVGTAEPGPVVRFALQQRQRGHRRRQRRLRARRGHAIIFARESHCNLHSSLARQDGAAGSVRRPSATRACDGYG